MLGKFYSRIKRTNQTVLDDTGYSYVVVAYGDVSRAVQPEMAVQLYLGDRVFVMSTTWTAIAGGWRMPREH